MSLTESAEHSLLLYESPPNLQIIILLQVLSGLSSSSVLFLRWGAVLHTAYNRTSAEVWLYMWFYSPFLCKEFLILCLLFDLLLASGNSHLQTCYEEHKLNFFSHTLTWFSLYWTLPVSIKSASLQDWFVKTSASLDGSFSFSAQHRWVSPLFVLSMCWGGRREKEAEGAEERSSCDSPFCPG